MRKEAAKRASTAVAMLLAALLAAAFAWGCDSSVKKAGTEDGAAADGAEADGGQQADGGVEQGPVTLTLYFLAQTPTDFYLQAEERTVPYTQAVARAALEELFKGPSPGSGLKAIFPDTVKVLDVSVSDGICTVNVSKEIITDRAASGGAGAAVEALALASIANTLTEFPTVNKVKLLVEGKQSGVVDGMHIEDFWGHVGLPEYLERNISLVGPR